MAFTLIGDVVYAASGSFYEQSVERRLFKPLGMDDASLGLAGIQASSRWARPHVRSRNGWVSLSPKPTYYRLAPAAGVNASASDMAQWLLAHTGHRPDVLPAPLLATLHSTLINTPGEMRSGWRRERLQSAGYALGWRVAGASGGAFDPTIGALADLWGFGPSGPRTSPPPAEAVEAVHAAAGLDAFELDPLLLRARRLRDARLDLSGIAKGHAVDALADALEAAGHRDLLVEIGGEFVGRGLRPDGQPWWVDVEPLPATALPPLRIAAHDVAIATSGDYRRGFTAGCRRYAHTLDPRTGRPIVHGTASVTVLAADCMHADAWATVLTVLPLEEARSWATAHSLAARIVVRTDRGLEEWLSPALQAMLG